MANKILTNLTALTTPASGDFLYIVDIDDTTDSVAGSSRKITLSNLVSLTNLGVTASAAELNILDGATLSVAELNILDGVTSSAAELNILDGATLSVTELNVLDGIPATLTAAEIGHLDGVTSNIQDQIDTKAPLASPTFTGTVTLPVGLTGVIRADSGVVSVDSDVTDIVAAASTSTAGKIEIAIASEVTTGTDATRAVSPDALAGSDYGKRFISIKVFDDATAATTGDGKVKFQLPVEFNGWNLVDVEAYVTGASSSGALTIQVRNITQAADILSTAITIDESELSSLTAATPPAINASEDDYTTGDQIAIDVDGAGTSAEGLGVLLTYQLP